LAGSCAYIFELFVAKIRIETQSYQCPKPAVTDRTCPMTANPG
jgi:hypothetical protein